MVEVFWFKLACWYVIEVFVDDCWRCCYGPSSKFTTFRSKESLHIFVCWNLYISPQKMSEQAPPAVKDGYRDRFFIAFLHRDLFVIFTGYLMLRICLSSFRWKASRLASSVCVRLCESPSATIVCKNRFY